MFKERILESQSSGSKGIFGFLKSEPGSLWSHYKEIYICDVCGKQLTRIVSWGSYTGVMGFNNGFKIFLYGKMESQVHVCEGHTEDELKKCLKRLKKEKKI